MICHSSLEVIYYLVGWMHILHVRTSYLDRIWQVEYLVYQSNDYGELEAGMLSARNGVWLIYIYTPLMQVNFLFFIFWKCPYYRGAFAKCLQFFFLSSLLYVFKPSPAFLYNIGGKWIWPQIFINPLIKLGGAYSKLFYNL